MSNYFAIARAFLASVDPAAPAAALVLVVFLAIYLLRRFAPRVWLAIENKLPFVDTLDYRPIATVVSKFMQALPGALLGAAVASLSSGASVKTALLGVLAGFGASAVHEVMAAYKGQVSTPKPPSPLGLIGGMLAVSSFLTLLSCGYLMLSLSGCGLTKVNWPGVIAHCAPSKDTLVVDVANILLNDSAADYAAALEKLAETESGEAVACAVNEIVEQLGAPTAKVTAKSVSAIARGKAFLAAHGVTLEPAQ